MKLSILWLVLASVLLSSGSQVLLKIGMISPAVQAALGSGGTSFKAAQVIGTSPFVLIGLACFGLSALLWLMVLSKIPLSSAYPLVALGIVITVLAGRFWFDEPISILKAVGVTLIVAGVVAVGAAG
jgi:multidrug transporter EmrE-like cation transporter